MKFSPKKKIKNIKSAIRFFFVISLPLSLFFYSFFLFLFLFSFFSSFLLFYFISIFYANIDKTLVYLFFFFLFLKNLQRSKILKPPSTSRHRRSLLSFPLGLRLSSHSVFFFPFPSSTKIAFPVPRSLYNFILLKIALRSSSAFVLCLLHHLD